MTIWSLVNSWGGFADSGSVPDMATVIPIESLRRSPSAVLFEGGDDVALSVFVTEFERGQGPSLHVHPYPELFLVETGTGAFTVGDVRSGSMKRVASAVGEGSTAVAYVHRVLRE